MTRTIVGVVCMVLLAIACFMFLVSRCDHALDENWRVRCANLATAIERRTKYDIHVSGGTCFVECPNGWVFADRYNGCR